MPHLNESENQISIVIAFRATRELVAEIEAAAAAEKISKADVARRAVLRDLAKIKSREAAA